MATAKETGCGAPCCAEGAPGVAVQLFPTEHSRFPEAVRGPGAPYTLDRFTFLPSADGFCVKLTADKLCSIYDDRPALCRRYSCEVNHGCVGV